jgi:hypothetical protein
LKYNFFRNLLVARDFGAGATGQRSPSALIEAALIGASRKGKRLTELERVFLIFDELRKHAGEEISSSDLLEAAQQLIKISRGEYLKTPYINGRPKPNYYSHDTSIAIEKIPWKIFSQETLNLFDMEFSDYTMKCKYIFRRVNLGIDDYTWEF